MTSRELINKYGILANKSLGQNFLHRDDIIDLIADSAAGVTDCALEIGAGLGVLSRALCDRFSAVTTVEIDRSLKEVTEFSLKDVKNHTMVYADFLRVDFNSLTSEPVTVVGNLPYYITGDILKKLFKNHERIKRAVVMVQKEAAEKLVAAPRDKQYRAISVMAQHFCNISTVCDVTPDCFIPAPHVDSRVIIMDFKENIPDSRDFSVFVTNLFNARRKKLTAVFKDTAQKQKAEQILKSLGFSGSARCEELNPSELYKLYFEIFGADSCIFAP